MSALVDALAVRALPPGGRLETVHRSAAAITWSVGLAGPVTSVAPDLIELVLPTVHAIDGFTSSWGLEFEPADLPTDEPVTWQVTSGRSSNGTSPWLAFITSAGAVVITVHWSGNWRFSLVPTAAGHAVQVGLHPDGQRITLGPGESLGLPAVSVATGSSTAEAAEQLVRLLQNQVPTTAAGLLTEWNHWWPYEDAEIDEATFLANAEIAADLGLEVAVLDAGWFGRSDAASDWVSERGDWHLVNEARFPRGLGWLADRTRALGIEFGIWIEAEAVGPGASVARDRPELLARAADGESLGYVCLGSPAGQAHVHDQVARLISDTSARWIKWDFNLDPGTGCARDDHGHRGDDGLVRHYLGLYGVLAQLRAAYPGTVLEACSSGGLRIDAGLAAHVDGFFLSDPDWTEHHLTCLWGAAQLLPPRQLLHWLQSEWRGEHRFQKVDYSGTLITAGAFDTKIRSAMLHRFGISVRLTEMRPELRERLRLHLAVYDREIRPLLTDGVLRPLTAQPLREEKGWRQPSFLLSSGDDHLLAAFRLPPSGEWAAVHPLGLDPERAYEVRDLEDGARTQATGASLLQQGLTPGPGATSTLWTIRPCS